MPDAPLIDTVTGFQVRQYNSFDEPEIGAPAWNELASRSDTNTVFQTHEWMTSWWKVFGAGRELLLIAVFQDNRLVGLAPLMREFVDGAAPSIAFVSEGNADYCDFLLAEPQLPVLKLMIATLAGQCGRWQELRLNNLPEQSFTARNIRALCADAGLLALSCGRIDCPAMVFGDPGAEAVSIRRRQSLKRPFRHFRSQGRVEFTELASPDQALAQLPGFFEQHVNRWREARHPSLFTNPRNREFYRELVTTMLPTGWLVFSVVTLDGQPLAYHFGFAYRHRYYWYKPSYDIGHRQHSPGNLLLRFLLLRAIERQCLEFDFTIGNEAFKRRYSNTTRRNQCLAIFPQRRAYVLRRLMLSARIQLKKLAFWRQ